MRSCSGVLVAILAQTTPIPNIESKNWIIPRDDMVGVQNYRFPVFLDFAGYRTAQFARVVMNQAHGF